MTRHIAIGDIHGCSQALAALVEAIQPRPEDVVITLGDYINRGPDSRGVIEQLLRLQQRCVLIPLMGNHEEMLMAAWKGGSSDLAYLLKFGGQATLDSYGAGSTIRAIPRDHLAFLEHCRLYHETDSHIFVHANCWPNRPMHEQPCSSLLWEDIRPERMGPHYSGKIAIVGHTAQTSGEILDLGFLKCIDTFCHGGGWLTALEVNTGELWQANMQGLLR